MTIHLNKNNFVFKLEACPFCGSNNIELLNTHTPAYWIECDDCTANIHGKSYGNKKDMDDINKHRASALSAIRKWNGRVKE
jgi:ribosomal protein L37AE/L43A